MKNGWTGGQYSLFRVVFGLWTGLAAWHGGWWVPLAGLLLAIGLADRLAAITLLATSALCDPLPNAALPVTAWLLLTHLATPRAPFGSWAARGRTDPQGGWQLPSRVHLAAWIGVAAGHAYVAFDAGGFQLLRLAAIALAFVPALRPFVWLALASVGAFDFAGPWPAHLLAFDPAWVPGKRPRRQETLYYDGDCGLCHRLVRLLLAEDREPATLEFASLGGETARRELDATNAPPELPDSVVVRTAESELLFRSRAVLHLAQRLGGMWRTIAVPVSLLPRALLDRIYDIVARIRGRVFARPEGGACPLLPPRHRARFRP